MYVFVKESLIPRFVQALLLILPCALGLGTKRALCEEVRGKTPLATKSIPGQAEKYSWPLPNANILSQGYYYDLLYTKEDQADAFKFREFLSDQLFFAPFWYGYSQGQELILLPYPSFSLKNLVPSLLDNPKFPSCRKVLTDSGRNFLSSKKNETSPMQYRQGCIMDANEHDEVQAMVLTKLAEKEFHASHAYHFSDVRSRLDWLQKLEPLCQESWRGLLRENYFFLTRLPPPQETDAAMRIRQYLHYADELLYVEQQRFRSDPEYSFFFRWECLPQWKRSATKKGRGPFSHAISEEEKALYELKAFANAPAYPANLQGASTQITGATSTYTMALDTSFAKTVQEEKLFPDEVHYRFTMYEVTELVKRGLPEGLEMARLASEQQLKGVSLTSWAANQRDLAQRLEAFDEDNKQAAWGWANAIKNIRKNSLGNTLEALSINSASIGLVNGAAVLSLGGFLVKSLVEWAGGSELERQISLPKKEGYYLIRCIATPKRRLGLLRASSVALRLVEVRSAVHWAQNALDLEHAQEAELAIKEMLAETDADKATVAVEKNLLKLLMQGAPSSVLHDRMERARKELEEEKKKTPSTAKLKSFTEKVSQLEELFRIATEHKSKLSGEAMRVRAALASEDTGLSLSLLLQIACSPISASLVRCKLSDVTSKEHAALYEETAKTQEEAVWKTLKYFSGHASYGRGALAVELQLGKMPEVRKRRDVFRLAPQGTHLLKDRVEDTAMLLSTLSLVVPGVGEVAMGLGAALAVERLDARVKNETLRADPKSWDMQAALDVMMVLAAAGSTGKSIGKFVQVRWGHSFALAAKGSNLQKLGAALKLFDTGAHYSNQVIAAGGIILGHVQLLIQLKDLEQQELEGSLSHSEVRQLRARLFLNMLYSSALFMQGFRTPGAGAKKVKLTAMEASAPPKVAPGKSLTVRGVEHALGAEQQTLRQAGYTEQATVLERTVEALRKGKLEGMASWANRTQRMEAPALLKELAQLESAHAFLEAGAGKIRLGKDGKNRVLEMNQESFRPLDVSSKPTDSTPKAPQEIPPAKAAGPSPAPEGHSRVTSPQTEAPPLEKTSQSSQAQQEKLRVLEWVEPTKIAQTAREQFLKGIDNHPLMKAPNEMTYTLHSQLTPDEATYLKPIQDKIRFLEAWAEIRVKSGKTNPENNSAKTLKRISVTNRAYAALYGKAVHSETFYLIGKAQAGGFLPEEIITDSGLPMPKKGLSNSYGRKRPDIRISLGNGREAVIDLTTQKQKNHVKQYIIPNTVYVGEHFYK